MLDGHDVDTVVGIDVVDIDVVGTDVVGIDVVGIDVDTVVEVADYKSNCW